MILGSNWSDNLVKGPQLNNILSDRAFRRSGFRVSVLFMKNY